MIRRALLGSTLLLGACAPPGVEIESGSETSDEAEDTDDEPATMMCAESVAETCGPLPCVVQQLVDLSDPDHASAGRPMLAVGSNCQPHALIQGNMSVAPGGPPRYATTHDGVSWTQEEPPLFSGDGSLFLDPVDDTPVVFGDFFDGFESFELRDGVWQPAGFAGPGTLEGAVRTHDGVTHVLAKIAGDHTLYSFTSPAEFTTIVIGRDVSDALSPLVTDRAREQLQTTYYDNPDFDPDGSVPTWWSWTTESQPIVFEFPGFPRLFALTAAGDSVSPRAYALTEDHQGMWFASRSAEGTWSRRLVDDDIDTWGEVFPDDPVEGQMFVSHFRSVNEVATVEDLDGEPRWIWSQIDSDEHWAFENGTWVQQPIETGTAALYIGWLDDGEVASRVLDDQLAVRKGDAVIDASGTLHLLVLVGPAQHEPSYAGPVYLRLGIE